jgi:hypothetical protein
MRPDQLFYALYDAKAKLYWDNGTSSDMSWFKPDPTWKPRFVERTHGHHSVDAAEKAWRLYEFQRTQYRPEIPKLTIRKLMPRIRVEDAGWVNVRLDPTFVMIQKMRAKHGTVMAEALTKLDPKEQPIYAIKRQGKTQKLVKSVLPETILHHGMFMFFYDDHDIVMAKIALGANIAYEYDLTPFHV